MEQIIFEHLIYVVKYEGACSHKISCVDCPLKPKTITLCFNEVSFKRAKKLLAKFIVPPSDVFNPFVI